MKPYTSIYRKGIEGYTSFMYDYKSGERDMMENPKKCTKGYRFGFNGMERDDEVKGAGNSYDFGARIHDPRLGRWLSIDPLQKKFPFQSPYSFALNKPTTLIDFDGRDIIPTNQFMQSRYNSVALKMVSNLDNLPSVSKYIAPFLSADKNVVLSYHNFQFRSDEMPNKDPNKIYGQEASAGGGNHKLMFNSIPLFNENGNYMSGDGREGQYVSELGMFNTMVHEFIHTAGVGHEQMASPKIRAEMKQAILDYAKVTKNKVSDEQADALTWVGLEGTSEFKATIGKTGSDAYNKWANTVKTVMWDQKKTTQSDEDATKAAESNPADEVQAEPIKK